MSGALQFYINDAGSLLHDVNGLFTPRSQLIRWINEARRITARQTGCIRRLITGQSAFGSSAQAGAFVPGGAVAGTLPGSVPLNGILLSPPGPPATIPATLPPPVYGAAVNTLQTIPGQERYPYQGGFNEYLQQTYAGCKGISDVINCAVNWGGAVRPALANMAWDDLQAYARAYSTRVMSYPYYFATYNDGEFGEIWLFPAPSTIGDIELDAVCVPTDLYSDDDVDAIPPGWRNAIKFFAAGMGYMGKQQYSQAQEMLSTFESRIGIGNLAANRGKTPNYYWRAF